MRISNDRIAGHIIEGQDLCLNCLPENFETDELTFDELILFDNEAEVSIYCDRCGKLIN